MMGRATMNDAGVVAATLSQNNSVKPVCWQGGHIRYLAPRTVSGYALDIHERGVVVGMLVKSPPLNPFHDGFEQPPDNYGVAVIWNPDQR